MCSRSHGSSTNWATRLENSDSSSKTIRIQPPLDKFHHDLTHENLGQKVTCPVYRRTPSLATWGTPSWRGRGVRSTLLPVTHEKCSENHDFLTIFKNSQKLSWSIRDYSRASLVVPKYHLNAPVLISRSSIFRPRSILMSQMWPMCHGSRPDGATGLENSDSSSKTW